MAAEGTDPLFVNIRTNTPIPIDASVIGSVVAEIIANGLTCNVQTFTASGTYTPSAGLLYAKIKVQAAGGGSGGADGDGPAGTGVASAGSGGGEYREGIFTAAQIGASQTITIGAPGAAGNTNGGDGGDADPSSVGVLIVANGGLGGDGTGPDSTDDTPEAGGAGGAGGSGGYLAINGQNGAYSSRAVVSGNTNSVAAGMGGDSFLGKGGLGQPVAMDINVSVPAVAGGLYGGGASGAKTANTTGVAGAIGGAGIIIVEEYIFNP